MESDSIPLKELIKERTIKDLWEKVEIVLEGQYSEAYELIMDAHASGLHVALIGPPGTGKTLLARKIAQDLRQPFYWVSFSELIRSSTLIGSFDPVAVFSKGFSIDSFIPGPFLLACLKGGIFFANEFNRGDEFVLNVMLDALEERRLYIPQLRRWIRVHEDFFMIVAMNPSDIRGTRRLPTAIKDRIHLWIQLDYPPPELEKKIILTNVPEYNVPDNILDTIIEIVSRLRSHADVIKKPSLRSSISLARFVAQRAKRLNRSIEYADIAYASKYILVNAIDTRPGVSPDTVVKSVIREVLGIE